MKLVEGAIQLPEGASTVIEVWDKDGTQLTYRVESGKYGFVGVSVEMRVFKDGEDITSQEGGIPGPQTVLSEGDSFQLVDGYGHPLGVAIEHELPSSGRSSITRVKSDAL